MSETEEPNICCICLEEEDIKKCLFVDKIRHIPCNCNVYAHKSCFNKTDKLNCLVCHNRYQITWNQYQKLKSPSKCNCIYIKLYLKYKLKSKITSFLFEIKNSNNPVYKKCYHICHLLFNILAAGFFIWFSLLIGGYLFNAIICIIFYDYVNTDLCWLTPSDPFLYLVGIVGVFIIFYLCGCICLCCICFNKDSATYRISPIV